MPPKSSAKKRREGKHAATAAEDRDNSVSSKESESAAESARALDESFKENEYAAESARVLDEALDRMTSDKQKQALLKVVTKFQNLIPVQIKNAALLIHTTAPWASLTLAQVPGGMSLSYTKEPLTRSTMF